MYGQQRGEGPGDLRCHSQRLRQEWARGDIGSDPWGAWFPWTRFSDEGVEEGAETFERREGCVEPEGCPAEGGGRGARGRGRDCAVLRACASLSSGKDFPPSTCLFVMEGTASGFRGRRSGPEGLCHRGEDGAGPERPWSWPCPPGVLTSGVCGSLRRFSSCSHCSEIVRNKHSLFMKVSAL